MQNLVGGGSAVNAWLVERGFAETRVNSRTRGREAERERWGWGQTTAREMAELRQHQQEIRETIATIRREADASRARREAGAAALGG